MTSSIDDLRRRAQDAGRDNRPDELLALVPELRAGTDTHE